jgi:hypothetical protein
MHRDRAAIVAVCILIAATAVAFGPLVTAFSLEERAESDAGGQDRGSLAVESVSFPETATIDAASYGAANHYVTVPAATVRIRSRTGAPLLVYRLRIEALGVQLSTVHFLERIEGATYRATMEPATIDREQLDAAYTGELSVVVIDASGRRPVANQTVAVTTVE